MFETYMYFYLVRSGEIWAGFLFLINGDEILDRFLYHYISTKELYIVMSGTVYQVVTVHVTNEI